MKIIDILPEVDLLELVDRPVKYLLDIWEFFILFYSVVNGENPSFWQHLKYVPEECRQELSKGKDNSYKFSNSYIEKLCKNKTYIPYKLGRDFYKISKQKLLIYLDGYINAYRKGEICGKKKNYKNFTNSQEAVLKIIQGLKEECGECFFVPIPYDTKEDKEVRFLEIIAYLYLNGNIEIREMSIDKDNRELNLQIRILHDMDSLYGITIDRDKNVLYKGKKVEIDNKKDEFTLVKELVDNKGKIDKQKFFEELSWGKNAERSMNRMNALKNRVLSKLNDSGADNLEISQAGAFIELKEREG